MTRPVTYYAQNEAIDSLAEKYGPSFDRMTREQKLYFLAVIIDNLSSNSPLMIQARPKFMPEFLEDCLHLIAHSSERHLIGLSMALTAQLYDGVYAEVSQ